MKRIIACIILMCIINITNPFLFAFAKDETKYKDIKGTNLQIKSQFKTKWLVDKDTKENVLPTYYKKIKKVKYKNNFFIRAEKEYPYIVSIYNPNGTFKNLIKTYYKTNNQYQNIKFENYPDNGILIFKKKDDKQGIIVIKDNIMHVTSPRYNVHIPDNNSIIARMLNISFAPHTAIILQDTDGYYKTLNNFYNSGIYSHSKLIVEPYQINEQIDIEKEKITVKYKDISPLNENKIIGYNENRKEFYLYNGSKYYNYENLKPITEPLEDYIAIIGNINKLYKIIKSSSTFDFQNYPETATIITNDNIYIFDEDKKYIIKNNYEDIFLFDKNLLINQITGLKISYQNIGNIIVKKSNKWGVVDKNKKVIIPFEYDEIYPVGDNITEKIENIDDYNASKLIINFIEKKETRELFFVKKSDNYGVIDLNNNIIVPFEQINYMENDDVTKITSQTKNTNKKKGINKVGKTIEKAIFYTMAIILFPVAIVCPPIGWVLMCGFEIY